MLQKPDPLGTGLACMAVLAIGACGGSSPAGPAGPAGLQVGGAYQITPTLLQDACGGATVTPGPAQVAHTLGASQFQLTHVGNTYSGRVDTTGSFTIDPLNLSLGSGATASVRIEGRFSTGGFEATVTVDETRAGTTAPCRYLVRWQATKQGPPNVLPS